MILLSGLACDMHRVTALQRIIRSGGADTIFPTAAISPR